MRAAWLLPLAGACAGADRDGDGFAEPEDCDDRDPAIRPGADDPPLDGVDRDCDGFDGSSDPLDRKRSYATDPPQGNLELGFAFVVEDIDGDGVDEVLAGSQESRGDYLLEGQAWLFDGPSRRPLGHWEGNIGFQLLGQRVDVARDADGAAQLLLRSLEGIWVLDPTAASGYPGDVGGILVGEDDPDDYLVGNQVAAMDVLGDPADDVVIECGLDIDGSPSSVCIAQGPVREDRVLGELEVIVDGGDGFATSFADTDVDGDGDTDLLVGADGHHDEAGAVYLFEGPLPAGHHDLSLAQGAWRGENPGDWLGEAVFGGDLDGDGLGDLLACAMAWPAQDRRGRLYGFGPSLEDLADAPVVVDGDQDLEHLGVGAAVADLDGDGTADLAVGSPGIPSLDASLRGRVLVFYGPVAGHLDADDAGRIFSGESPGDQAGWVVRAGEVDGDGATDLLISAPMADHPRPEAGRIYLLNGPVLPW